MFKYKLQNIQNALPRTVLGYIAVNVKITLKPILTLILKAATVLV